MDEATSSDDAEESKPAPDIIEAQRRVLSGLDSVAKDLTRMTVSAATVDA